VLFDGFRPLAVQQWLWGRFLGSDSRPEPGFTDEELGAAVRQFVAFPQADPLAPPPHRTGGAVDVYLIDSATGKSFRWGPRPMRRCPPRSPAGSRASHRAVHHEPPPAVHVMTGAGFTNYLGEWWHFDYGNQRWANVSGASAAVYGAASDPDIA
jgi:D-alanyl-D-alanine dipeptidase